MCTGALGAERFTEIPKLEEDIAYIKEKNIQPIEYYLNQC